MKKETSAHLGVALLGLILVLSASPCVAQSKLSGSRRMIPHQPSAAPQLTARAPGAAPAGSLHYTFTMIDFPGAPATYLFAMNPSATPTAAQIVGAYGPVSEEADGSGALVSLLESQGIPSEAFQTVNFPGGSQQTVSSINDAGQVVGIYTDSMGAEHGYELIGGNYTTIDVPFQGATNTTPYGINNGGTIVGCYNGNENAYEMTGGTYTQLAFPGAIATCAFGLNDHGDVVGFYEDAQSVSHGFLLSGGTYTSFDVPGSTETIGGGVNDADEIVGWYCLTTVCAQTNLDGTQGFLLSKGNFSTINGPGASDNFLQGISDNNVIVGEEVDCAGLYHSFIATLPSAP